MQRAAQARTARNSGQLGGIGFFLGLGRTPSPPSIGKDRIMIRGQDDIL
jgi:hypothetical protein